MTKAELEEELLRTRAALREMKEIMADLLEDDEGEEGIEAESEEELEIESEQK